MISNESCASYNRPMLTKTMLASLTAEQIAVEPESWYEENDICQILGRTVVSVDTEKSEVILDDESQIHFTRLIYALGSECFIPPIPGSGREQVIAVRRISDVEKISGLLKRSKNAVVIGGGVLGLEAAWELKKAGLSVTVLEAAPMLMGRQLDATAGSILEEISRKNGIAIHTSVSISSIDGDESGAVIGVSLSSGETFPADLVIVSAGVRANTGLAQEMGLKTEKAVVVNSRMETGMKHIYACGDCAEYKGANFAIWPEASEQGRVAGANAAGDDLEYRPVSSALTFNGMNTSLYAAGDNGKNPNLLYKTVEFKDMGKEQYRKFYFLNNRLCGVILIGDLSQMARMSEALEQHASYKEVVK